MPTLPTPGAKAALDEITLPDGGKLFMRPWGTVQRVAGSRAYLAALVDTGDRGAADVAYAIGAVRSGVAGWEGFGTDADPDAVVTFDPELLDGLEALLHADYDLYSAVHDAYVSPGLRKDAEKNASSLPLAGGSPAGATKKKSRSSRAGAGATTAGRAPRPAKVAH